MNLSLNRSDDAELPWLDESVVEPLRLACKVLGPSSATINVVVVDDSYIRKLNREFRNIDKPTDVLSFSFLEDGGASQAGEDDVVGEIYISHQTVAKEAKILGVDASLLFVRIGVHGLLHVIGHEHGSDQGAARMEREEMAILSKYLSPDQMKAFF